MLSDWFKIGFCGVPILKCCFLGELCGRGVGKMILRLMQGFFGTSSGGTEPADLTKKGIPQYV